MRSFRLILLMEEISEQPRLDSVVWSLVSLLIMIYNEKEQAEWNKLQNVHFEEKKSTSKWNGAKSCVQGNK